MPNDKKLTNTIVVEDINQFVKLLSAWHSSKVDVLNHMMEIPSGTEVTFNSNEPVVLEGNVLKGFVMGISLSLMELGELPFAAEMEEPEGEDHGQEPEPTVH